MAIKTETLPHAEGFLVSEARGRRSRQNVTIASGQSLKAGQVLGKHANTGKYGQVDLDGSNGLETASAVLLLDADATSADVVAAAVVRDCEVNKDELTYAVGSSVAQKAAFDASLLLVGIVVRSGPTSTAVQTQTT
jgi:hypothetical protein